MGLKPGQTTSTSWKKGQSGNPNGRPPMPADLGAVKRLTGIRFEAIVAKFANMSLDDLNEFNEDTSQSVLELTVCAILIKARNQGDQGRLNFLLERTVGKVKEVKEIQVMPSPFIVHRPNGEQLEMGAKAAVEDEIIDGESSDEDND